VKVGPGDGDTTHRETTEREMTDGETTGVLPGDHRGREVETVGEPSDHEEITRTTMKTIERGMTRALEGRNQNSPKMACIQIGWP